MKYFALSIAVLFILTGVYVLLSDFFADKLTEQFRVIMGIILILYGIFRIVVTLNKKKDN